MDSPMRNILHLAKLEELLDVFMENEIGIADFRALKDDELRALVPKLGHRVRLRSLMASLNTDADNSIAPSELSELNTTNYLIEIPPDLVVNETITNTEESEDCSFAYKAHSPLIEQETPTVDASEKRVDQPLTSQVHPKIFLIRDGGEERSAKRLKITHDGDVVNFINSTFDLKALLQQTSMGKAIIATYDSSPYLTSKCQGYLTDIIASYFLDSEFPRLTNPAFEAVAKAIAKCFPNEKAEVYYTPPLRKRDNKRSNKSVSARGKFTDRYRNKVTFLRAAKVVPNLRFTFNDSSDSETETQEIDEPSSENQDIIWLKSNVEPWNKVQDKWSQTYDCRRKYFLKNTTVAEIYEEWPILKLNLSYTLIDEDFSKIYEEATNNINNWEEVFEKLLIIRRQSLTNTDSLFINVIKSKSVNTEYRCYLMLALLAALIPCKTRICKGKKQQWRPTTEECRASMLATVELAGDIENKVTERKEVCRKNGTTFQPFIIVELQDDTLRNVYVNVEDTLYKVPSMRKAIDVCFKTFHVFNLQYPLESEHLWLFIQLCIYEIHTNFDNNIPTVIDIVNKVKKL